MFPTFHRFIAFFAVLRSEKVIDPIICCFRRSCVVRFLLRKDTYRWPLQAARTQESVASGWNLDLRLEDSHGKGEELNEVRTEWPTNQKPPAESLRNVLSTSRESFRFWRSLARLARCASLELDFLVIDR